MVGGACIPQRVHTVVISVQHSEKISLEDLRQEVMSKVVKTVIPSQYLDDRTVFHINPCGQFVMGGPQVNFKIWFYRSTTNNLFMICFLVRCWLNRTKNYC